VLGDQGIEALFPARVRYFSLFQSDQTGFGTQDTSYFAGAGDEVFPGGKESGCELTTYLQLASKLKMNRAQI